MQEWISTETSVINMEEEVKNIFFLFFFVFTTTFLSGSSSNTCSEEYRGERAFSEPESRAVRDFITSRKSSMVMYLSFHSWGQMVLYPWGYDSTVRAKDQAELHRVGQIGARALGGYKVLKPEQ